MPWFYIIACYPPFFYYHFTFGAIICVIRNLTRNNTKKIISAGIIAVALIAFSPLITRAVASFFVGDNGYIGIGTSSPLSPLDVSGAIYSRMTTATSSSINWNLGNVQYLTLTSSPTLTFTNGQAGGQYTLIVNQDATGNRSVTWPSSVRWSDGIEPGLSTSASSTDLITFVYDGSRYLGSYQLAMGALAENLISYWKLDESSGNASDSIGSNTLTNNNSTTYSSGKINNAGNFVASSSNYFSSGTSNGFPTGSSPRSVSLWFKLNSLPSDSTNYIFFNYGSETTNGAFGLSVNGGTGSNRSLNLFGYSNDLTYSVSNIQTGTWYHYVGTFDGTTAKIYLNGALATSGNKSSWNTSSGTAARIGALISASPGFFMDGLVDEVGIWSRTLTSDEVNTLYNSGSGRQM